MAQYCRYPCVHDSQFILLGLVTIPIYVAIAPILFLSWCIQQAHLCIAGGSGCCCARSATDDTEADEIMLGEDQLWASQDPHRWASNNHPIIDCVLQLDALPLSTLQGVVQQRWVSQHPRFSRRMARLGSKWAFQPYAGFDIEQHVRLLERPADVLSLPLDLPSNPQLPTASRSERAAQASADGPVGAAAGQVDGQGEVDVDALHTWSQSDLVAAMSHMSSQPLCAAASPWCIWLIPRMETAAGQVDGGVKGEAAPDAAQPAVQSAVIFRINHAMVDGVGLVRLLLEQLVDAEEPKRPETLQPLAGDSSQACSAAAPLSLASDAPPMTPVTPPDAGQLQSIESIDAPAEQSSSSPAQDGALVELPAPTQAAGRRLCLCDMLCRGLLLALWEVLRMLIICPNRSTLHGTSQFIGRRSVAWSSLTSVADLKQIRRDLIAALARSESHSTRRITFNDVLMGLLGAALQQHAARLQTSNVEVGKQEAPTASPSPPPPTSGPMVELSNSLPKNNKTLANGDGTSDCQQRMSAPSSDPPMVADKGGGRRGARCMCCRQAATGPQRTIRINIPVNLRPRTPELKMKNEFSLLLFDLPTGVQLRGQAEPNDSGHIHTQPSIFDCAGVRAVLEAHEEMSAYKASGVAFAVMLAIKVTFATLPTNLASWLVDLIASKTTAVSCLYSISSCCASPYVLCRLLRMFPGQPGLFTWLTPR